MELSLPAARVLGCLVEKALATPAQHPLTLVALRAACNQSTNRDPVVDFDERAVRDALGELRSLELTRAVGAPGSRTLRYAHLVAETYGIEDAEQAVLAVLLLRGPQTVGELRARCERLHAFASVAEVHDALTVLVEHHYGALAVELARRPGQKEVRFATTLHPVAEAGASPSSGGGAGDPDPAATLAAGSQALEETGAVGEAPPDVGPPGAVDLGGHVSAGVGPDAPLPASPSSTPRS